MGNEHNKRTHLIFIIHILTSHRLYQLTLAQEWDVTFHLYQRSPYSCGTDTCLTISTCEFQVLPNLYPSTWLLSMRSDHGHVSRLIHILRGKLWRISLHADYPGSNLHPGFHHSLLLSSSLPLLVFWLTQSCDPLLWLNGIRISLNLPELSGVHLKEAVDCFLLLCIYSRNFVSELESMSHTSWSKGRLLGEKSHAVYTCMLQSGFKLNGKADV